MFITKNQIHSYLKCSSRAKMVVLPFGNIKPFKEKELIVADRVVDHDKVLISSFYLVNPGKGHMTKISSTQWMELKEDYTYFIKVGQRNEKKYITKGCKIILKQEGCVDMLPQLGVLDPVYFTCDLL